MVHTADEFLAESGATTGDRVRFEAGERSFEGVLMPRHAASQSDVLILKLSSGYNVGVRFTPGARLSVLTKAKASERAKRRIPEAAGKPVVAVLGTGGTIASFVDYRTGAVHPAATAEELAFATPELFEVANVQAEVVFQVFSEDLEAANWTELAKRVKASFEKGAKGVVIPHGTDTLHYTAAALSFALDKLPGPVVLVGSQRSSDRPSSDAASNLLAAVRVAAQADLGEVVVCMHDATSDGRHVLIRGTRARKNHTSRRDAFDSMNVGPLGLVDAEAIRVAPHARPRSSGPVSCRPEFESNCRLVWSGPLLSGAEVSAGKPRGVVFAGTGLGHVPRRTLDAVAELQKHGVVMGMASQCLWGRTNLNVYSTGRDLLARGVVGAEDMTPETALVKLMWLLANTPSSDEARRLFVTDLVGEIAPTTPALGDPR